MDGYGRFRLRLRRTSKPMVGTPVMTAARASLGQAVVLSKFRPDQQAHPLLCDLAARVATKNLRRGHSPTFNEGRQRPRF